MVPIEHLCAVLRVVALHGPTPASTLTCWHIDGVSEAEQRAALLALVEGGFVTIATNGTVDLRGVDRSRWVTMGDVEKHARADAIESAVRCATLTARARESMSTNPTAAMKLLAEVAREGVRGIAAARRADEAAKAR